MPCSGCSALHGVNPNYEELLTYGNDNESESNNDDNYDVGPDEESEDSDNDF